MYPKEYVFPLALTPEWRAEIQRLTQDRLSEMLGVEVDNVMAEYVLVMVGNKKNMAQISHDLIDFIGEESAEQFVEWLSDVLPSYEAKAATDTSKDATVEATLAPTSTTTTITPTQPAKTATTATTTTNATAADAPPSTDAAPPAKRIISLKGSSANVDKKLVPLTSSRSTIRSLNRPQDATEDVLAKRSQRFGAVEKSPPRKKPAREEPKAAAAASAKRKASGEPESVITPAQTQPRRGSGGRLSQLLGPPVNVDQAELDARDSLNSNKRKKVNPRAGDTERPARPNGRANQETHDADGARKGARRADAREQTTRPGDTPPLPPGDQPSDKFGGARNGARGPHGGYFNGPPGYGGFPPPPYGHPMYFQPPPFGQMPPPYGMGFPPHHGGPGRFGGPGPYGGPGMHGALHHGGRAPRPAFQNRTWVNPNATKSEDASSDGADASKKPADGAPAAGGANAPAAGGASGGALNPSAPAFAPRNPYYASQMRPRFQNKTWVRQDPAKDEEFSLSLPTTPPPDGAEAKE